MLFPQLVLILCPLLAIDAATLPVHTPTHFAHNATLHRRNNINKYDGCDKMYTNGKGKDIVYTAYQDMLKITQLINPFLTLPSPSGPGGSEPELPPGVLENRFFGDITGQADRRSLIHDTFGGAANWYPWFFFDWIAGGRIEVYCEKDQPSPQGYTCGTAVPGETKSMIAYATNLDGKAKIVFCAPFFTLNNLAWVKTELTSYPDKQKDVTWLRNTGQAFFHEMTHLSIIESRDPHIIIDNKQNPVGGSGRLVYGAKNSEYLARDYPAYAFKNADNYAWYAMARWALSTFGVTPDPSITTTTTGPDFDFPDLYDDDGSSPAATSFDDLDYDEISSDEGIAFAAGDYTPNGWLQNTNLRILPLGDSITNGYQSSDGNGYRNDLVNILVGAHNTVQMIGSLQSGTMADNYNEGHNGATIAQIATFTSAYGQRPNVVLLHAGTNDLNLPSDPAGAPQRLDALVGQLFAACPDATIIVARIIPSSNSGTSTLIPQFNNAITDLMSTRAQQGQHVIMVDMPSAVSTADLADGLHPNDGGYNKMAIKWAISLTAVNSLGWIKDPVQGSGSQKVACSHDPTWISQGQIANGGGLGANLWLTVDCSLNAVSGLCDCERSSANPLTQNLIDSTNKCDIMEVGDPLSTAVHFADLNGDGRAEYLYVDGSGAVTAFLNLGGPDQGPNAAKISWLPQGVIATGVGANRSSVQFADINGDGRAEYLWIHDDGSVDCWLNLGGPDNGPNAGKVSWLPQGTIATGVGKDGAGVRFADLNGDGRAEYLYVNPDGSVEAYLNLGGPDNGANAAKVTWLPQGTIATGVGQGRDNVVFADINGDGRADYLAVSRTDGSTMAWINGGGPDNGPNAAKVVWYPHGTIGTGVGTNGKGVQFADLNGDSRAEYLDVDFATSAVNAWLNGC